MLILIMRTIQRLSADQKIFFFSNNEILDGIITNCSEEGMYIETAVHFPFDLMQEILILHNSELINVRVEVVRLEKRDGRYNGMGVKVLGLTKDYFKFLAETGLSEYLIAV